VAAIRSSHTKPAPTLTTATAKTRSAIENLQARLAGASPDATLLPASWRQPETMSHQESEEDLERQLEAYFASAGERSTRAAGDQPSRARILDDLRDRVIDGVVERILEEMSKPTGSEAGGLGHEVMERLMERVLDQVRRAIAAEPR
jgi:hypothetical protein